MTTRNRRLRYRGDRSMQMLIGLFGYCLLGVLLGIALSDWMVGTDTLAHAIRMVMR